jgi:hypothetical protein
MIAALLRLCCLKSTLLFLLYAGANLSAQTTFQKRFGSHYEDNATKVIQTQDGNFLIVGITFGFGSAGNGMAAKVSPAGDLLWIKDYPGINYDKIYDVIELPDGDWVMCGLTGSFGTAWATAFAMKTDHEGNLIWGHVYGDSAGWVFSQIEPDGVGGFYVVSGGVDLNHGAVCRLDSMGHFLWGRASVNYNEGAKMVTLPNGDVVLGCIQSNSAVNLSRLSRSGICAWSKNFQPQLPGILSTPFAFAGQANGNMKFAHIIGNASTTGSSYDVAIATIDANGGLISASSYGGNYEDYPYEMEPTPDGGIIVCGQTNSAGNGDYDAMLMKIDSNEVAEWAMAYGNEWVDMGRSALPAIGGGYMLTGMTHSVGTLNDSVKLHVVKTDSIGNAPCNAVSWTAIAHNQPFTVSNTIAPVAFYLPNEYPITWTAHTRTFHTVDFCATVAVDPQRTDAADFEIYPNPFSTMAWLQANGEWEGARLEIHNVLGQRVRQIDVQSPQTAIERDGLPAGMYTYRVLNADQALKTGKIVIE